MEWLGEMEEQLKMYKDPYRDNIIISANVFTKVERLAVSCMGHDSGA